MATGRSILVQPTSDDATNAVGKREEIAMTERQDSTSKLPDPVELSRTMASIAERSQRIVQDFLEKQDGAAGGRDSLGLSDPLNIGAAFLELTTKMMADPARMFQAQLGLWQDYMTLWQATTSRMLGGASEPVVEAERTDRRFKDQAWDESYVFDYIKQTFLLTARWMQKTVQEVDGLDDKTRRKVDFYTRQFVDAMAPSNFVVSNPEVLRATMESGGENLVKGLENLVSDLERGHTASSTSA